MKNRSLDEFFFNFAFGKWAGSENELGEHFKGVFWLVHWDHVTGVEHSEELEVLNRFDGTSSSSVDTPVFVFGSLEFSGMVPCDLVGPGFSTSPVADEVLISGVDEHIKSSTEDFSNLW